MATAMLAAEKKLIDTLGMPVANMWCTHRPKLKKPVAIRASTTRRSRQRRLGHVGHDHRHHAGGRHEDDVDLRVTEEPEQMLPQQRVAALGRDEERPVEGPLELEHQRAQHQCREGEDDHAGEHQHGPGVDRDLVQRHARRPRPENADDDLDGRGDDRDFDKGDAQQPEVGIDVGRELDAGQRRIHEPAPVGGHAEEQAGKEDHAADDVGPESVGAEPRERHVARALHARQQIDRHAPHDRGGEQEHHHAAVHGEELVEQVVADQVAVGEGELGPHQHRQQAGHQEEEQGCRDVQLADIDVVDDGQEAPAPRRAPDGHELLVLLLGALGGVGQAHLRLSR
jgi:hypothetical protein